MSDYPMLSSLNLPEDIKKLSYEELEKLACETRWLILNTVSKTGGHLAPSLGVVELTIALLRVTSPIRDRIIWDVSHQSYPYKILTDRFSSFQTLRQFHGISGFSKITESPYDAFGTGHATTSISAGLGMTCADEIKDDFRKIVAVIGDGALTGGLAFEAMNNLGFLKRPMVVVLNDNEMSIGKNVGALSGTLSRMVTGELSTSIRKDMQRALKVIPHKIQRIARRFEEGMLSFFTKGIIFEELGLRYVGPIDGHNIKDMEKALNVAFECKEPVLLHVVTTKGKGYKPAEEKPSNFHGISSFDLATGKPSKFSTSASWTSVFGNKMLELAEKDEKVVAITAAMADGTGLLKFAEKYPDRFFDTGIAEGHAMIFAAGLAASGIKPYIALYSSFLQRAFDQLIHDVAIQKLPVRICIDRAGLVGQDGPTHHGTFDISMLRMIPDIAIFLPKNFAELNRMMDISLEYDAPMAIRYARGGSEEFDDVPDTEVVVGEAEVMKKGGKVAIVSAGHIFPEAWRFQHMLSQAGIDATFVNLRFLRPVNKKTLSDALAGHDVVFTFEENVKTAGAGEFIQSLMTENQEKCDVQIFSLPNSFVTHGSAQELRVLCGLTAEAAMKVFEDKYSYLTEGL